MLFDPTRTFDDNVDNGPFIRLPEPSPFERANWPLHSFLGVTLYAPLGVAAGPLPTSKHTTAALAMGFDIVTYKTQRSHVAATLPFPNCINVESIDEKRALCNHEPIQHSMTNSFGNPSRGPEYWIPDVRKALTSVNANQVFILSVYGSSEQDLIDTAALAVRETNVKFLELNVSCPNVCGKPFYTDSALMRRVLLELRRRIGWDVKLIVKLGFMGERELEKLVYAIHPYIDAICAVNSVSKLTDDLPGRSSSGVCGALIKPHGLRMVDSLKHLRKINDYDYKIMGCGGVLTLQDYKDYRAAGADAVMCAARVLLPNVADFVQEVHRDPGPGSISISDTIGLTTRRFNHSVFVGGSCKSSHHPSQDCRTEHRLMFNLCNYRCPDVPATFDMEILVRRVMELERLVDSLMDHNTTLRRFWTIDGPYLLARELHTILPLAVIEIIYAFGPEIL
jgi:dihydroorotate dehydrogenase